MSRAGSADGHWLEAGAGLVVGADGIRSTVAGVSCARTVRTGTGASACTYGYWSGLDAGRLRVELPPRRRVGCDPDQRRPGLCLRQRPPGAHRARRARRPHAHRRPLVTRARRSPDRRRGAARAAHVPWPRRPRAAIVGTGVGTGRRRGLLQGPAQRPRPHRRHARRRATRPCRRSTGGDDALAGYQARRDELSADLFDVIDVIAGHQWTDAEIGSCCASRG